MTSARTAPLMIVLALAGAGAGWLYAVLTGGMAVTAGMVYGGSIAACITFFERGLVLADLQARMRQWPTLLFIPAMEAATVCLALLGFALAGVINWGLALTPDPLASAMVPSPMALLYALLIAAVLVTLTRVRDLLGHEVFTSLLIGRYHRPVEERRIFLFLDLVGSSDFARRHGDLRAQAYLGAVFAAITEPVLAHRGAIDDYIGDMVMVTWPESRGLAEARCVACVFAITARMEAERDQWLRRFGQVPRFHAALHGGAIVTAEVGIDRHKISYFGDVVNTTARIETLCRELSAPILVSADLLRRLPALPAGVRASPLGSHPIKGHEQALAVYRLDESGPLHASKTLTEYQGMPRFQHLAAESAPLMPQD